MSGITMTQLNRMYFAVDHVANLEGQDPQLVIEMSQAMLNDLIDNGELKPMIEYVKYYCDVIESTEDAERIAEDI
jgi:tellurite resistance protein